MYNRWYNNHRFHVYSRCDNGRYSEAYPPYCSGLRCDTSERTKVVTRNPSAIHRFFNTS